jgi:hypothetical protein
MSHLAILPEAKIVDYLCSFGDSGLSQTAIPQTGSRFLPAIFCFLADYLNQELFTKIHSEWKVRYTELWSEWRDT